MYAHSLEGKGPESWQRLEDHLRRVADKAGDFAGPFGAAEWGRVLGAFHDIGKQNPRFQQRLTGENTGHADHKGAGARLFENLGTGFGRMAAYCIAGHHGGLPDFHDSGHGTSLGRVLERAFVLPEGDVPDDIRPPDWPFVPESGFQCSFFTRMLFSALVDADFLDTEAFMDADRSNRREPGPPLDVLREALDRHLAAFDGKGRINSLRAEILAHCREQAALDPGLFTLTVPTGGGKTLTSMAFALDHALRHGLRRVVYVIPYTSIIEQNARVFRDIFPDGAVIEHHSNFDPRNAFGDEDNARESAGARRHRLACENWDAPVVVTTNVQFFESLFAAKPSRCRKLHNLAGSVIVLDEAQMLPVDFLDPCLRALEELAAHYGCSVVLCTATQPALRREDFAPGLAGLDGRELAPDPARLHSSFRRTELRDLGELALPEVADLIREREQVLCIVNTRARASELFELVRDEPGARHLSALMCPAHRSERLAGIRAMLRAGEPCRVISTQLVEAGVDVSLPEVIREMAGLDSITQAAGRCNREGEREEAAPVSVFYPAEGLPRVFSAQAEHAAAVLRGRNGGDPFSPEAIRQYFGLHYWLKRDRLDRKRILDALGNERGEWYFRRAADEFRLIDNPMAPVIVPWDDRARELVEALRYAEHPGGILRKLQQYTVQVYEGQFRALDEAGAVETVADGCEALCRMEFYDDLFGLRVPGPADPEYFWHRHYNTEVIFVSGVKLKVWGEYACFTRPEMKVERVSYDVMTPSAARGILEAVYWKPSIRWVVDRIHVMKPIRFDNVRRNEVSAKVPVKGASGVNAAMKGGREPLRLFIEDNRQQRATLVLRDVEYVIEAHFEYTSPEDRNDGKHLDMFNRRAGKGQCFHRPYLGCREFAAFFEPVKGDVPVSPLADEPPRDLGWMLYDLDYRNGMAPLFFRPALERGVVEVAGAIEREGVAS